MTNWAEEIRLSKKWMKPFIKTAESAEENYRSDETIISNDVSYSKYKMPVFWSSIQTLKPAIFSAVPKCWAKRRYGGKSEVANLATKIIENVIDYCLDQPNVLQAFQSARDDFLIAGRGTTWVRYDAKVTDSELINELVIPDHVHWSDFLHNPCRNYSETELTWVARKNYLTKEELKARFGVEGGEGDYIPGNIVAEGESYLTSEGAGQFLRHIVYEIWDRSTKKVIWFSPSLNKVLEESDPPINFLNFFPCPLPVVSALSTSSALPVSEYGQICEHVTELNGIIAKQRSIRKALRVAGVYDASLEGIQRILSENLDVSLVPVENFARFLNSGGFQQGIVWWPIDQGIAVLIQLYEMEQKVLSRIYEISGYSDLMRGSSVSTETATAQKAKVNFGSLRINQKVRDFENFVKNTILLMAEVVCEEFSDESLYVISGGEDFTDEERSIFPQSLQFLRSDFPRSWVIDIETSDTAVIDEELEKEKAGEFVTAISNLINSVAPIVQTMPMLAPVFGEAIKFSVRKFRTGKSFESSINKAVDEFIKPPPPPTGPPPEPPEVMAVRLKSEADRARLELEREKTYQELELERIKLQEKIRLEEQSKLAELELEREKAKLSGMIDLQEIEAKAKAQVLTLQAENEAEIARARAKYDAELQVLKESLQAQTAENLGKLYPTPKSKRIKISLDPQSNQKFAQMFEELHDGSIREGDRVFIDKD